MQQLHSPNPIPPPPPLSSSSALNITSQAPNLNYNTSAPLVFLNEPVRPDNSVADQSSAASHEVFGPYGMTAAAAVAVAGSQKGYPSNNSITESNIMHSTPHPHSLTTLKDISYTPAMKYPDFDNVSEIAGSTITTVTDIPPVPSKPIVMKFNLSMKKKWHWMLKISPCWVVIVI